jgi:hypothetical protein
MTATDSAPAADTWAAQLEQLRARYKHIRPPVLAALNVLIHDQDISLDDAKAQAALHGVRITAASVNAARTLLSRMDVPVAATPPRAGRPAATAAPRPTRAPRRPRAADAGVDAESLIQSVVAKIQAQGSAEADRLRDAMRRAIDVLNAAVGA